MRSITTLLLLLAGMAGGAQAQNSKHPVTFKFINGKWFNGTAFEDRNVFVKDGLFTSTLSKVDTTVDLKGQYVIPPFSEAHSHSLEGLGNFDATIKAYLRDGVFYVKNPNNIRPWTEKIRPKLNSPHTLDAVFANGGLTSTGGHPELLYEDRLRQHVGSLIENSPRGWFKDKSYYNIDSEKDFLEKWPAIKEGKPDFIKVYLANSEDIGKTPPPSKYTFRKGLDPALVVKIVKKAHDDGLRVAAHVETRIDFLNALEAGVDEITHVPGFYLFSKDHLDRYRLTKADAELAARKKVFVCTAIFSRNLTEDPELMTEVDKMQAYNISMLQKNGALVVIGSDHARSPHDEMDALVKMNILDNATLLKMWCETSAQSIFPKRKLGLLKNEYESSFVVLPGNPIQDFGNTKKVTLRFKQGHILTDADLTATGQPTGH